MSNSDLNLHLSDSRFARRTASVDVFLRQFNVVAATGSILEAHLMARLGLSGGIPNLIGCGTDSKEVLEICLGMSNILLIITESISDDLGKVLIETLRNLSHCTKIFYIIQDEKVVHRVRLLEPDAVVMVTSFGSGVVVKAIAKLASAGRYLDPAFVRLLSTQCAVLLSNREQQVLHLLAQGMTNKEMAMVLALSPITIRDYVKRLMFKLDAKNRTMVVTIARSKGLI